MALLRTINAPGVEIREIDRSDYTQSLVGTHVLVPGFAAKGEDYIIGQPTTRSSFLAMYGEPTNEAERYFYNACMEVINQNGVLYTGKLPYDNDAKDYYVGRGYKIGPNYNYLSSVSDYISEYDLAWLLAGYDKNMTPPGDDGALISARYILNDLKDFQYVVKQFTTTAPAAWLDVSLEKGRVLSAFFDLSSFSDNWVSESLACINHRIEAVLDPQNVVLSDLQPFDNSVIKANISNYVTELSTQEAVDEAPVSAYLSALVGMWDAAFENEPVAVKRLYENVSNCTRDSVLQDLPNFTDTPLYAWLSANQTVIDYYSTLADYTTVKSNPETRAIAAEYPFIYFDERRFNLGSYIRAIRRSLNANYGVDIIGAVNGAIILGEVLSATSVSAEAGPYQAAVSCVWKDREDVLSAIGPDSGLSTSEGGGTNFVRGARKSKRAPAAPASRLWEDYDLQDLEDRLFATKIWHSAIDNLTNLIITLDALIGTREFEECQNASLSYLFRSTEFSKKCVEYYLDHVYIGDAEDRMLLATASNLSVLGTITPSTKDTANKLNFFELYNAPDGANPELSGFGEVISAAVKTITVDDLYRYATVLSGEPWVIAEWTKDQETGLSGQVIDEKLAFAELTTADPSLKRYMAVSTRGEPTIIERTLIDDWSTQESLPSESTLWLVDKMRGTYGKTSFKQKEQEGNLEVGDPKEIVGVIPVLTTAANALWAQDILDMGSGHNRRNYQAVGGIKTLQYDNRQFTIDDDETAIPYESDEERGESVSYNTSSRFPPLYYKAEGQLDRDDIKKIGIVVLRAYVDTASGNEINYDIVEAFAGEVDPTATDPATGATTFIDTIVNKQSDYIYCFSNCARSPASKKQYDKADILALKEPQIAGDLGFFASMSKKTISLTESIYKGLNMVFDNNLDVNHHDIDIVVDAGISNIAQYISTVFGGRGEYDPASTEAAIWKLRGAEDGKTWRTVIDKFNTFCGPTNRWDAMFIADGPRPFCLQGNKKLIRPSKPANTIDGVIIPKLKYITGLNTNRGAGYCNWFEVTDEFTGNQFWCPPSIKAMGIYIYTDTFYNYWDAPAGLNRGVINNALDTAFSPNIKQAGNIYLKNWNYAVNYPNEGIVLEGQKTFQVKASAFDRVNVRRLFLRLERLVYRVSRYFTYETNNTFTRNRFVDQIEPSFSEIKYAGGIYDYLIKCDESLNTPQVIDNNELRIAIGLQPARTIEFIMVQFVCTRTGVSIEEYLP